jgi:hypothetical protein
MGLSILDAGSRTGSVVNELSVVRLGPHSLFQHLVACRWDPDYNHARNRCLETDTGKVSVLLSNPVGTAAGAGALVVGFEFAIPTFYRPIKEPALVFAGLTDSKKT